jgi:predicted PurR-regulated permease PerM
MSLSSSPPPPSEPTEVSPERARRERRAFGFLALVALVALIRLALPLGMGLFLGALLAFTLQPMDSWLRRRGWGPGPSALVCALAATTIVSSTVAAISTLLVTRGLVMLGAVPTLLAPGGALRVFAEGATRRLTAHHVNVADLSEKLQSEIVSLGSRVAGIAAEVAEITVGGLLTLLFMTMAAYFVLRHWSKIVSRSERMLPFERRHTHALLDQFRTVGRQVLLGNVVTGLVQGLFAAFGYWATGVPEPAFFGALTALASLVPGVGTLLVWVSVGVVQILTGHVGAGLVELTYSVLTVGILSDYVIRPRMVGSEKGVPTLLTFVALFGGVEVFGIIGLILGPVIVTLSVAILRTYERELADLEDEAELRSRAAPPGSA